MVIEALARSGRYLSQFVTGTSNGGLTAHPGGDRWRWESRMFQGHYDASDPEQRPVYGAVNHRHSPYGGSVRFGSCHLRLQPEATLRSTFCFPDSAYEPVAVGGPDRLADLLALADDPDCRARFDLDDLDDYVEAHVHGGVRLEADVAAVVLDPCFAGGPVEAAADRSGCPVEFHPGFRVETAGLDPAFRGQPYVDLAQALGPVLTPDLVGEAARDGGHDPQDLKRVWHYLARFGRVAEPA